jgi:hypothetical protein
MQTGDQLTASPSLSSIQFIGADLALRRTMQTLLLRSVLFIALAGGCAGSGQLTYAAEATTPELVVISPGVQVIADFDEPIFYSGNYYWRNQGGYWYRSAYHTRGWARVDVAPVEIRTIERPSAYVHYRGPTRAHVSHERPTPAPVVRDHRVEVERPTPAPVTVVRDHRVEAEVRDHREVVAPAPRRADKHDDHGKKDDRRHDDGKHHDDDKKHD